MVCRWVLCPKLFRGFCVRKRLARDVSEDPETGISKSVLPKGLKVRQLISPNYQMDYVKFQGITSRPAVRDFCVVRRAIAR